jgi:hypothetical protein
LERSVARGGGKWHVNWEAKFGEAPERYWRHDEVVAAYRDEHPEWSEAELQEKVQRVFEAQQDLLKEWYNSQRRFHRHASLVGLPVDEVDNPDVLPDGSTH